MLLKDIFSNTHFASSLFIAKKIAAIEHRITSHQIKGKTKAFISCLVRDKELSLTPEKVIQL